jgi:competence protein ComEC
MDLPETSTPASPVPAQSVSQLVRIPMVPVAGLIIVGLLAGLFTPAMPKVYLLAGAAAALAGLGTLAARRLQLLTQIVTAAGIVLLASGYAQLRYDTVARDDIVLASGSSMVLATVTGRIVSAPQTIGPDGDLHGYVAEAKTTFLLRAQTLHTDRGDMPISGLVTVVIDQPTALPEAGQLVKLPGRLTRIDPPSNPGQFDWREYQRRRGIRTRLTVPAFEASMALPAGRTGWLERKIWQLRTNAAASLTGIDDQYHGDLITAMVLGERSRSLSQLQESMVDAGVAHFLSISGLHLAMALVFVYGLCRLINLSPRVAAATVLVLLGSYLLVAQWRVPLIRAALMAAALCLATLAGRKVSAINSLALAATVILLVAPLEILSAGFQLSFAIVAAVLVATRPLQRVIFARFIKMRGLLVFRRGQWFRRWAYYRLADGLMFAVAMALAAYIAAAPLVAYHFGLFTPWAPLLGLVLSPLVALVVVFGYGALAISSGMPATGHALGQLAGLAGGWLARAVEWSAWLPGRTIALQPVGPVWLAGTYLAIGLACFARRFRGGVLVALLAWAIWLVGTIGSQQLTPRPDVAELNLLAIGNGQCGLLRVPSGEVILIDAGTQSGFDSGSQTIMPFLRARKWPAPTAVFISHANTDHYNALPTLIKEFGLRRAYVNATFGLDTDHTGGADAAAMLAELQQHGVEIIRVHAGQRVDLDDRTRIDVLWPPEGIAPSLPINDRSLVLKITCDDVSVLLPGDLQPPGRLALLNTDTPLAAHALILPHHGSWAADLPAFIQATGADLWLQSVGRSRAAAGADSGELSFFAAALQAGKLHSTYDDGWLEVRFGRGQCVLRTMRQTAGD